MEMFEKEDCVMETVFFRPSGLEEALDFLEQ